MKLDLTAKILDLKGNQIQENGVDLTLGEVLAHIFLTPAEDERHMKAEDKLRRFKLALEVSKGGVQDFKEAELDEIEKIVGKVAAPIIVGRVNEFVTAARQSPT